MQLRSRTRLVDRARVALPAELLALIFDELALDVQLTVPLTSYYRTGAACCLVSRAFLPLGRHLLYYTLDNRDAMFLAKVAQTHKYPHLGVFVDSLALDFALDGIVEATSAGWLAALWRACPNITVLQAVESIPNVDDDAELELLDRTDQCRIRLLVHLLLPGSPLSNLREFVLDSLRRVRRSGYEDTVAVLQQANSLHRLDLRSVGHCATSCGVNCPDTPTFDFPHLRHAALDRCATAFATAVLVAAPALLRLDFVQPCHVFDKHPTFVSPLTSVRTLHYTWPSSWPQQILVHGPVHDIAGQIPSISNFLRLFPGLESLRIGDLTTLESLPPLHVPPSTPADAAYLSAFAPTLRELRVVGMSLIEPFFASPHLLATEFPSLEALDITWMTPETQWADIGGPPRSPEPEHHPSAALARKCMDRGVRLGGSLLANNCIHFLQTMTAAIARADVEGVDRDAAMVPIQALWRSLGEEVRIKLRGITNSMVYDELDMVV